ncbi:MAG: DUF3007 family protein [Cyanobacteria bacterium]|nr:DUF3007 family protein [Cyanobacteriota bacterium]MDW8202414.1 DUF3007 family protein [Cyanobacteriota bacterium SKYGB_h_bin112]
MRRIDIIGIGIAIFVGSGAVYGVMRWFGLNALDAGIWSQVVLILGLLGWLVTYLYRALTKTMTYNQQLRDYETAVLQKRLEEMTPEELAALQAELEQDNQSHSAM